MDSDPEVPNNLTNWESVDSDLALSAVAANVDLSMTTTDLLLWSKCRLRRRVYRLANHLRRSRFSLEEAATLILTTK
jgi:hypothetical protein